MKPSIISAALALAAVLAACNPAPPAKADIRAVHASVDTPAVDILVDSAKAGGPIEFKSAFPATGYAAVDSGVRNIKVCAAPADTACPINASPTLAPSAKYTIVALGTIATADDTGADPRPLEPLVLTDAEVAPAAGKTKLRLIHGASLVAAKTVDVYITAPAADIATATATKAGFNYKDNSGYLEVAAGSYRVRITAPGTKTVLIDTGTTGVALADGKLYTGIAVNPTGLSGVILLGDN
jgi:predicted small secreted protein